jgi:hypothetical protein
MAIVGCLPLRAINTEQNTLFTVQMEILHPPDASLIGLYSRSAQTKVFACVMEKNKIKYSISYSSPLVHGTEFLSLERRIKNRMAGFCLVGEATN